MTEIDNSGINVPRRWSKLSYAGETRVPAGITSRAGSWPTFFLQRNSAGQFVDSEKNPIVLDVFQPDLFNFDQQLSVVEDTLRNITEEQIAIAKYWGTGPTTKQWGPIVAALIETYQIGSPSAERIWAAVQAGVNDAMVVTWHLKYLWDVARPNQLDQSLATILPTPKHPTHPAGHAAVAGCYQAMLSHYFPTESDRLQQLAEECSISRLYAGVHFPADLEQGLSLGRQIGGLAAAALAAQHDLDYTRIDHPVAADLHAVLPPPPY